METKLEPCPFCGNNTGQVLRVYNKTMWQVRCVRNSCGQGPAQQTSQEATKAWNMRPRLKHAQALKNALHAILKE